MKITEVNASVSHFYLHSWLKEWKLRADREERKKQKDTKQEEESNGGKNENKIADFFFISMFLFVLCLFTFFTVSSLSALLLLFADSDWELGEGSMDAEDMLCNTMLITGPTGVGKTAAVYACAQELGFKVRTPHVQYGTE